MQQADDNRRCTRSTQPRGHPVPRIKDQHADSVQQRCRRSLISLTISAARSGESVLWDDRQGWARLCRITGMHFFEPDLEPLNVYTRIVKLAQDFL